MAAESSPEPRARLAPPPHIARRAAEARRGRPARSSPVQRAEGAGPSSAARPRRRRAHRGGPAPAGGAGGLSSRRALLLRPPLPRHRNKYGRRYGPHPRRPGAGSARPPGLRSGPPSAAGEGAAGRGVMYWSPLGVDAGPAAGPRWGCVRTGGGWGRLSPCAPGPLPLSRPLPPLFGPVRLRTLAPAVRTQPGVPLAHSRPLPLALSPPQPSTQTRWRLLFLPSAESSLQASGSSGGRK